jgi:hypothetical protein
MEGEELDRLLPTKKKKVGERGEEFLCVKKLFQVKGWLLHTALVVLLGQLLGVRFMKTYELLSMKSVCP